MTEEIRLTRQSEALKLIGFDKPNTDPMAYIHWVESLKPGSAVGIQRLYRNDMPVIQIVSAIVTARKNNKYGAKDEDLLFDDLGWIEIQETSTGKRFRVSNNGLLLSDKKVVRISGHPQKTGEVIIPLKQEGISKIRQKEHISLMLPKSLINIHFKDFAYKNAWDKASFDSDYPEFAISVYKQFCSLSQEIYKERWNPGIEYDLWEILIGKRKNYLRDRIISKQEIETLDASSNKAGGWWLKNTDNGEINFILFPMWEDIYLFSINESI